MNKPRWMLAIIALLLPTIGAAQNPELSLPDFRFIAPNATESVNISLGPWLLHTMGSLIDEHDADSANAKRLLAGIQSIRVRTYQFDSDALPTAAIDSVRRQLEGPGWSQLLQSRARDDGERVEIYVMTERDRTKGFADCHRTAGIHHHQHRRLDSPRGSGETRAALAGLVREHQRSIYRIALRMLGSREGAEDLTQEVFMQLSAKIGSIASSEHLRFWLRQVTANRAIDELRRTTRFHTVPLDEEPSLYHAAEDGDPLLQRELGRLPAQLSAPARAVVLLRYQEDLDPVDIARTLEMPINTVKSHLKRSLETLRSRCEVAAP